MSESQQLRVQIAEPFEPLYDPYRHKVFYGGRGATKSWEFARAILVQGAVKPELTICAREYQTSIEDSVHRLLSEQIQRLNMESFYTVQANIIKGLNGTEMVFKGLKNNINNLKSFEGADRVWVEEAQNVSERSWDVLIPTIRKQGSEIWVSFNPEDELDPTYQRFVVNTPHDTYLRKINYNENPWFWDSPLVQEMEECKKTNYNKYLHIWEGECNTDYEDSIIQPEWFEAAKDSHIKLGFDPRGITGMGFDPADTGNDDKAYAIRHGSVVTAIEAWSGGDIETAIDKAFTTSFEQRLQYIVYDGIGVGAAIKVGLKDRIAGREIVVTNFIGGETPRNPDEVYNDDRSNKQTFRNLRAQWWWYLRDRFEKTYRAVNGEYIDPDELISISTEIKGMADLKSELCRVQRKRGQFANTYIQVESKDDMKRRQMPSPNKADALVMCFANMPPKSKRTRNHWPELGTMA